jgi:hypothetical protein
MQGDNSGLDGTLEELGAQEVFNVQDSPAQHDFPWLLPHDSTCEGEILTLLQAKQLILGLENVNERLGTIVKIMNTTEQSINNFIEIQDALNAAIKPFRCVFEVRISGHSS